MPDLEVVRDLLEFDLELAGSHQGPIPVITSPPEKTWIWSDLHLGDRSVLFAFDRPFHDVDRMNGGAAYGSDDTIICLGDVAHPDAWDDRRLVLDIQNCPGERVLILGNHDLDREALREAGFTTQYSLALCATDPPLVLSHYPLHHLPVGAMNVHGHLHNQFEPTAWHINLAVEGIDYSSVGLVWVLDNARQRHAAFSLSRPSRSICSATPCRTRAPRASRSRPGDAPRPPGLLRRRGDIHRGGVRPIPRFLEQFLGPGATAPGGSAPGRDPGEHGAGEVNRTADYQTSGIRRCRPVQRVLREHPDVLLHVLDVAGDPGVRFPVLGAQPFLGRLDLVAQPPLGVRDRGRDRGHELRATEEHQDHSDDDRHQLRRVRQGDVHGVDSLSIP